ncbi:response regulator [Alteromonadaceae bacterium BrNp21-10]|nr:response regulator [Alteromonadaceae bacterium BrNp21-10]
MGLSNINVAIVEDNGAARLNLRNHLMPMGFNDIGCYSHGRELKQAMNKRNFHIILMDYHLELNNNGVEVVQELQQAGILKPSTAVIFVTAERMPMVVGQIVDVHPDAVILKPYTIRSLEKTVATIWTLRQRLSPVYDAMDKQDNHQALELLEDVIRNKQLPKSVGALNKLRARLLIATGQFSKASALYQKVLDGSDQVVWAKWGLIHSLYLDNKMEESEAALESMLGTKLTKDKACEWLARINIKKTDYDTALTYMDKIKDGDLSITATKLKVHLFQTQGLDDRAIELVEKKRESFRNFRERFSELSLELARCHMGAAEKCSGKERENALQNARLLIGSAARRSQDENLNLKRNYMNAVVAILDNNEDKALEILKQEGMRDVENADVALLSDAASVWNSVGDTAMASEFMHACDIQMAKLNDENDKAVTAMRILKNEETLGDKKTRALEFNKRGLKLFGEDEFKHAIDLFYQAYLMFPSEPAFLINLLQSMVEARIGTHKQVVSMEIFQELKRHTLSESNKKRFQEIQSKLNKDIEIHQPKEDEQPI